MHIYGFSNFYKLPFTGDENWLLDQFVFFTAGTLDQCQLDSCQAFDMTSLVLFGAFMILTYAL